MLRPCRQIIAVGVDMGCRAPGEATRGLKRRRPPRFLAEIAQISKEFWCTAYDSGGACAGIGEREMVNFQFSPLSCRVRQFPPNGERPPAQSPGAG